MQTYSHREQAARIYRNAATYIRKYGWQKTGMGVHGRPRCSMGALASAHPVMIWDEQLSQLMYAALTKELCGTTLTAFNERAKNGNDVVHLFERIAASLSRT